MCGVKVAELRMPAGHGFEASDMNESGRSRPFLQRAAFLFKESFNKWNSDNVMRLSASLAYYTAFSLAPLLLAAISVAGLVFGDQAASGQIYHQLKVSLGPSVAEAIEELVKAASKPSHGIWGAILAFAMVLFGASGVCGELKDSLNIIWKVQPKAGSGMWRWVRGRFLSIGMVMGISFLLLVSLVVDTGLGVAAKYSSHWVPGAPAMMQVAGMIVSFVFVTLLFVLLFKYLPDARVAWGDVWIGSTVTALLFTLGKSGLEIYISKAAVSSSYGAAGALALVLVWVYYSAQIFLMGAEFTSVYALHEGSRSAEPQKNPELEERFIPEPASPSPLAHSAPVIAGGEHEIEGMNKLSGAGNKKLPAWQVLARLTGVALAWGVAVAVERVSRKRG
jgi:membrane protein